MEIVEPGRAGICRPQSRLGFIMKVLEGRSRLFLPPQGTDRNDFASERRMNGRGAKMEAARPVRRLLQ